MRIRGVVAAVVMASLAVAATDVRAHHGWSGYDSAKPLQLEGVIKDAGYEHPHGFVQLERPASYGWWCWPRRRAWKAVACRPRCSNPVPRPESRVPQPRRPRRARGPAHHDRRQDDRVALMHEPVGPAFLVYLETSGLATLMRQSQWLYPIVEIRAHPRVRDAGGQRRDVRPAPAGTVAAPAGCRGWRGICCAGRWGACCSSCRPAS